MTVIREVMTPDPRTIEWTATVREAIELMERDGIRHLPVLHDGGLVGILSDRDLRAWRQALLDLRDGEQSDLAEAALSQPVVSRMTSDVETVGPDAPLEEALALLVDRRVGALPVVDGGRVVGVVSVIDVLARFRDTIAASPPPPP